MAKKVKEKELDMSIIENQKIVDIELTPGNEEVIIEKEKYQYLENIIIKFENGYSLLIEEGLDNPVIHIIRNKENM